MALQNLAILYTSVLRAEICSTFGVKVVQIFARNKNVKKNWRILQGYIFHIVQHIATKLCSFAIFEVLFSAEGMNLVFYV